MTVENFLMLLTILSVATSLLTECVKKTFTIKLSCNILVFIISLIVGSIGTLSYYTFTNIDFTVENVLCVIFICLANWMCAMLGYDKVIQAINQIKG